MDEIIRLSIFNKIFVGGKWVKIIWSRNKRNLDKKNEVFVLGLGEFVNEDVLCESFFNYFSILENDIGKVVVIWEKIKMML